MPDNSTHEELRKKIQALEQAVWEQDTLRTKLAHAIEIAHLGPWEYDFAEDRFKVDSHFYRMLRTTAEQVGGHSMSSAEYTRRFVHPEDRHLVEEEIRKAMETTDADYSRQMDHRIVYPDGTIGYVTVRFSVVKDAQGHTIRSFGVNQDITERKRIEEALRESEGYLRSLIRSLPDLVWLKNPEGVYISCNSRFEKFFGAEEKDIVGKTDYAFVDKDLADFFRMHDKKAIAKGSPSINEEEVAFADDGHREILETIKTPMYKRDGRLIGVLGIGRDITERKRLESALKRSIEFEKLVSKISSELAGAEGDKVDSAIDHALAAIGAFTDADRAYVFQFKEGGLKMDNTHEWCAGGIAPQIDNLKDIAWDHELPWFADRIRNHETFHIPHVAAMPPEARLEQEHFEAQGIQSLIVVPIETSIRLNGFLGFDAVRKARTWSEEDRNILRFLGETIGLVIERKRTEKALRESEARWQFALEGAGDGVWDWNLLTNRVYLSPRWKTMLGYNDSDIENSLDEWRSRVHPDDREAVHANIERHLRGKTPGYMSEHRLRCKNGYYKWVLDRGKIIEWQEDGKPLRIIGTHTDISTIKQLQAEHEQLIGELKTALKQVKQLSGLLPICSYCKKIRDDKGYWKQIETYIHEHSEAEFSHSICQECLKKYYPEIHLPDR